MQEDLHLFTKDYKFFSALNIKGNKRIAQTSDIERSSIGKSIYCSLGDLLRDKYDDNHAELR